MALNVLGGQHLTLLKPLDLHGKKLTQLLTCQLIQCGARYALPNDIKKISIVPESLKIVHFSCISRKVFDLVINLFSNLSNCKHG